MGIKDTPPEVQALYANIKKALNDKDAAGRKWGDAKFGVYAFYDFDGEPIYVGQTREKLRTRIRRHLTNQRTDAVAMFVLDPYEVHTVKVWPFWQYQDYSAKDPDAKAHLSQAEWTVYAELVQQSRFGAVLNEGDIVETDLVTMPESRAWIIAAEGWEGRNEHPDVRTARRAQTFAALAKIASERDVSTGLRRTLVVQAQRLLFMAGERYKDLGGTGVGLDFGMDLQDSVEDATGGDAGADVDE